MDFSVTSEIAKLFCSHDFLYNEISSLTSYVTQRDESASVGPFICGVLSWSLNKKNIVRGEVVRLLRLQAGFLEG